MRWRIPIAVFSAILFIWGALPFLVARIRNVGVFVPVAIGLIGLAAAVFASKTEQIVRWLLGSGKGVHIAMYTVGGIVGALVLLFIGVSVLMLVCANKQPPSNSAVTVVVPGAQIHGDRPSLMLSHRLQAAAQYLEGNPHAVCVVSGGQGADEQYSEAAVMRVYLVDLGIAPERIYVEDRSTNTTENMQFTRAVIEQNGLPDKVVIATQEFHQYRCAQYARAAGLQPVGTATCGTPWYLLLCYWVREFAGINRMWLLGY